MLLRRAFAAVVGIAAGLLIAAPPATASTVQFAAGVVDVSSTPGLAEGEEFVAPNPADPTDILIGSNQWQPATRTNLGNLAIAPGTGTTDCAIFDSHDGGKTWRGQRLGNGGIGPLTLPLPSPPGSGPNPLRQTVGSQFSDFGNLISADQSIVWDHHGHAFYQCIYFGLADADVQVWAFRSDDGGRSWGPKVVAFDEALDRTALLTPLGLHSINTLVQIDRPFFAVDNSGGPRDGTVYMSFETMFYQALAPAVFVRSYNPHATSWGAGAFGPITRVDTDAQEAQWDPRQFPQVGADGTLYVLYDVSPLSTVCSCFPGSSSLVVARSTDGGVSFAHSVVDPKVARITSQDEAFSFFQELIAAFAADPADANRLAVAWPDAGTGAARIMLRQSVDGGKTWGSRIDAADDPPDGKNQHDHAALSYLPDGSLLVAWRDRRGTSGDLSSPFQVFIRVGQPSGPGLHFGPAVTLTTAVQPPTTGHHGDMPTEYMSVAGDASGVHASWDQLDSSGVLPDNVYRHVSTSELLSMELGQAGLIHPTGLPNSAAAPAPQWSVLLAALMVLLAGTWLLRRTSGA